MTSFMEKIRAHYGAEPAQPPITAFDEARRRYVIGDNALTAVDLERGRRPPSMSFDAPDQSFAPRHARTGQLRAAAAKAAQYVDDLEGETDQLKAEASTLRSHISVLEESNEILQEEINSLRRDNERLTRENTAVATRVEMAAEILLALRKPVVLPPPPTEESSHVTQAAATISEAAIEEARETIARLDGLQVGSEDPSNQPRD